MVLKCFSAPAQSQTALSSSEAGPISVVFLEAGEGVWLQHQHRNVNGESCAWRELDTNL